MRTTLTLDDDLVDKLKALAARRRLSFKDVVNDAIRRGISTPERAARAPKPFRVVPFESSFALGVDVARLNQLSDDLEVEGWSR